MPELVLYVKDATAIQAMVSRAKEMIQRAIVAGPVVIRLGRPKRSLDQNAKMWAMLADVSKQVEWYGQKLSSNDWKNMFTASLKKQRSVPGIDGGVVILGQSTSRMKKQDMSDLLELMSAFGAEHDVKWRD